MNLKTPLAGMLTFLLVAACGGGSDDSNDVGPSDDAPADGVLTGQVLEVIAGAPLADVTIALHRDGAADGSAPLATTSSATDGTYRFESLSRGDAYRLDFSVPGYRDERYERVDFVSGAAGSERALEPVRLVAEDNAGTGGLEGTITSAVDGQPLGGLLLNFRRGINVRDGEIVATTRTADDGGYSITDLEYGNLTCEIVGEGLQTTYTTVQVVGGTVRTDQNGAISPRVAGGETRIVLTWGATPRDLDSHLTGPGADGGAPFHVFYAARVADGVNLDVDDISSFGPETITVDASREGVYRYSVHRFSNGTPETLSASGARVQVIRADGLVSDFFVPRGQGDLWTVFDLIDGEILPINEITVRGSRADHFAPELRQKTGVLSRDALARAAAKVAAR